VRRSSAPANFGSIVSSLSGMAGDLKESPMVSPRTVLGEGNNNKEPDSPVTKLRSWWAAKKADKQPATVALPTMPFLEEAFEDDFGASPGEDKGLLFDLS